MKTEIIVSVEAAAKHSTTHEPDEFSYFTLVQGFDFTARPAPADFRWCGSSPIGMPYRKAVTISLPDYITEDGLNLRSAYNAYDGNADLVVVSCDPIRVGDSIESAIDAAIKTIVITAPTKPGKRERLPLAIESVTSIFGDTRPDAE